LADIGGSTLFGRRAMHDFQLFGRLIAADRWLWKKPSKQTKTVLQDQVESQ
jgi:hypothetical protein